jgi:hypothetical protein
MMSISLPKCRSVAVGAFVFSVLVGGCAEGRDAGFAPPERYRVVHSIVSELEDGGSSYQNCYFDAEVELIDGRVGKVVSTSPELASRDFEGALVYDLARGLDRGRTVPLPVHFREDGRLHGGYAYCRDQSLPPGD